MTYLYTFPNGTTPDEILVQTVSAVDSFIPMFLLFIFFVVGLGGSRLQEYRKGRADYPLWFTIAGLSILILTLILGVVRGLISLEWTVVVFFIVVGCGLWLFLDRKLNVEG